MIRAQAEALAMALEHGAVDVSFAVRWADARIVEREHPAEVLLELSLASQRSPLDLVGLLQRVPGELVPEIALALFVQLLSRGLEADPSRLPAVIRSLFLQAGNTLRLDDELEHWASLADDRLCLSAAGIAQVSFESECEVIRSEVDDFARSRSGGLVWPSDE